MKNLILIYLMEELKHIRSLFRTQIINFRSHMQLIIQIKILPFRFLKSPSKIFLFLLRDRFEDKSVKSFQFSLQDFKYKLPILIFFNVPLNCSKSENFRTTSFCCTCKIHIENPIHWKRLWSCLNSLK